MRFSRQENWNGLPFPSPGDLPNPGIEPGSPAMQRPGFSPWVGKIPWRRKWQPTPVFLPGESHGWRSLVGCSPQGRKESDMTERLHFHFSLSCIGEGSDSPLQCSCLEDSMDGGAWWATVHGVTKSWTRLSDFTFFHFGGLRSRMPPSQKKKIILKKHQGRL